MAMTVVSLISEEATVTTNLLTLEEVAAKTRVPVATLRYWRSMGTGPETFRLGRRVMAFEECVNSWIKEEAAKERSRR
jgi:predicted DNA-binding transcriptional regulator AlpA